MIDDSTAFSARQPEFRVFRVIFSFFILRVFLKWYMIFSII